MPAPTAARPSKSTALRVIDEDVHEALQTAVVGHQPLLKTGMSGLQRNQHGGEIGTIDREFTYATRERTQGVGNPDECHERRP